ncbi:hypothetical protein [Helicobacter sp. MIT 05-5294]|uniref:hypothetical protein n=1 Tax=Helicobacter sp. MIT 05-5294 TaxID=1548150 RepID=UPI00051F9A3C|nr:hypothetical protein [Helicobacter sp. MIT 05-5294]TLD85800.1 hypothetical protein LS69_007850 [Helicobacter sp. MIT 05-5294]
MTFKSYPKEYIISMLQYREDRTKSCIRNIKALEVVLRDVSSRKEIKNKALVDIVKERRLLRFLESNNV